MAGVRLLSQVVWISWSKQWRMKEWRTQAEVIGMDSNVVAKRQYSLGGGGSHGKITQNE